MPGRAPGTVLFAPNRPKGARAHGSYTAAELAEVLGLSVAATYSLLARRGVSIRDFRGVVRVILAEHRASAPPE